MIGAATRARYVLSGWVRQNIQGSGSVRSRRGRPKQQGDGRLRRGLCAVGRSKTASERSLRPGGRWKLAPFEGPISRMRNAGEFAAACFLDHVATHETTIALDFERSKAGIKGIIHTDVPFSPKNG